MRSEAGSLDRTVEDRLAEVGQRYTAHRRSLIAALAAAKRPLAIADLLTVLRGVPQSSAYRNLGVLEEAGIVRRVITEGDYARFELDEGLTAHHHHLVCENCGRVEDVEIPGTFERSIDRTLERLARDAGFATVGHRLDLIGRCRSCA